MRKKLKIIYALIAVLLITNVCKRSPFPGFNQTENGLYYKIIRGNSEKALPVVGDVLTVEMKYYLHDNDSLLYSTIEARQPAMLPIQKSMFKGDINEGLLMITEGDSACFIVKADSFLIYNVGMTQLPPYVNAESMLRFEIKVLAHKTANEYMTEMNLRMEKQRKLLEELKNQELIDRNNWLKENNITVEPTPTGLYFISQKTGSGPKIQRGDLVKVHYTGYFLNGQVFDSSEGAAQPFSLAAGKGEVIQGWDEAILLMRVGGKARIILPSELAYGESDPSIPIPPYSTLIFDIEVIDVEKPHVKAN